MARIPYPDIDDDDRARITEEVLRTRGQLLNLFRALLHAPAVAEPWLNLGTAMRFGTGVSDRARELAICQVARRTDSAYEWHHHAHLAAQAGVPADHLASLPDWDASGLFDDQDSELLAYVDDVIAGEVDDQGFARIVERYGTEQAVELTATASFYVAVSRFLSAMNVEVED